MSGAGKGRHGRTVGGAGRYRARHAARRRSHLAPAAAATGALALAAIAVSSAPGAQAQELPAPGSDRPAIVTLSKVAHHAAMPSHYTVRSGDTLSAIAGRIYGNPALWPALWWINKATVANPDSVAAGQSLKLSGWHPLTAWLAGAAMRAIPAPPPPRRVIVVSSRGSGRAVQPAPAYRNVAAVSSSRGSYGNVSAGSYGGFQSCVIARESGGNSQVMNSTGHYGLYQFSSSTWAAYGGSSATFGHASVAEQNRVFGNAMARGGQSNWSPYDGC